MLTPWPERPPPGERTNRRQADEPEERSGEIGFRSEDSTVDGENEFSAEGEHQFCWNIGNLTGEMIDAEFLDRPQSHHQAIGIGCHEREHRSQIDPLGHVSRSFMAARFQQSRFRTPGTSRCESSIFTKNDSIVPATRAKMRRSIMAQVIVTATPTVCEIASMSTSRPCDMFRLKVKSFVEVNPSKTAVKPISGKSHNKSGAGTGRQYAAGQANRHAPNQRTNPRTICNVQAVLRKSESSPRGC